MNASEYNGWQYDQEILTDEILTKLVEFWQRHKGLTVDGFCGPNTINSLRPQVAPLAKVYPLLRLDDGRLPTITSEFYTENPSRSSHKGVDFFYKWLDSDPDAPIGDGGAVARRGQRRWWIPEGTYAVAAAAGVVMVAEDSRTGHKVWIDHGSERTGYFHLQNCTVNVGDLVTRGAPLGLVGDNPNGHDATHLHFEVSPVDRYAPMNPRLWLAGARHINIGK